MGRVGGEFWAKYYWNEKFQTVLERPTTTPEEAKQRSSDIHGLARLYVRSAFLKTMCKHCTLYVFFDWSLTQLNGVAQIRGRGGAGGEANRVRDSAA